MASFARPRVGTVSALPRGRVSFVLTSLLRTCLLRGAAGEQCPRDDVGHQEDADTPGECDPSGVADRLPGQQAADRSEEHTSELQSRGQLVCRLLLEKKNMIEKGGRVV